MRVVRSILVVTFPVALLAQGSGPQLAPAPFARLTWRNIGPTALGGHIDRVVVARVRGQPDQIYVAGPTGGVFKSTSGGLTWTPVFDEVNAMMSIGDVAVAPSN